MSVARIFRRIFPDQIWSLSILNTTAFHFLGKQKHNLVPKVIYFFEFHFKVNTFLKFLGWFISAVPFTIPCLPAAFLCLSAIKKFKDNTVTYRIQAPYIFIITTWHIPFCLQIIFLFLINYFFLWLSIPLSYFWSLCTFFKHCNLFKDFFLVWIFFTMYL